MNRRIEIARHWLLNNKNGVSFSEIISKVFDKTCGLKAKPYIINLEEYGEFYKVSLKDLDSPLFYPKKMALRSLYQVISESTDPTEWHFYEIPETKVNKDDVVVDCGAAEGLFSLLIANRCKEVYAIEPIPKFVEAMRLTFLELSHVHVIPCALSNKEGESFIAEHDISSSISNKGTIPVKLSTIDKLFFEKNKKIDYLIADL